ncbi:MAG: SapC family protein, partial [Alteromonas oceani]
MPLVFIQDPKTNKHHVVAMLGIEPGQNLFLQDGKWNAPHIPMNIIRYPFDVRPDGDKLGVYIDENSDLIKEEGQPLFKEDGNPSDFLNNRQQLLGDLANSEMLTQQFVSKVVELDLLNPMQLRVQYSNGQGRNVGGILTIDEKKLVELSDEQVVELHRAGFMGALYAMMLSLGQLNRLIELFTNAESPIKAMQMEPAPAEQAEAAPQQ